MHNFIHTHFPELALVIGVILLVMAYMIMSRLSTIVLYQRFAVEQLSLLKQLQEILENQQKQVLSLGENVELIASGQDSAMSKLHAIAAHFVPRLRTEWDEQADYYFEQHRSMGLDPQSKFFADLIKNEKNNKD